MQGKMVEEEQFNVSLPQILEMIFLDVNLYIAVFWAGDQEFCDKGTFVHIDKWGLFGCTFRPCSHLPGAAQV
jgi:hypothetical protein